MTDKQHERSRVRQAVLKSIKEGVCVACEEIQAEVPDCTPGTLSYLAREGLVKRCGTKNDRYAYEITRKGLAEINVPASVVKRNLLGAPGGSYTAALEGGSNRPGSMDAYKLPSRRDDGLHVPTGVRYNLCSKDGR